MKILCLLFLFISYETIANELTIVAVGEAEQEKEKITFALPTLDVPLTIQETKKVNLLVDVIASDFKFYRHKFDVSEARLNYNFDTKANEVIEKDIQFFFQTKVLKKGKDLIFIIKVSNAKNNQLLLESKRVLNFKNIRKTAHEIADEIYQELTGKESIFTKKIIFLSDRTSRRNQTRKELYIMDFDGKNPRRLTYQNSMIISPAISPDNKKVLYSMIQARWRRSSRGRVHKVKNLNLYLLDIATGKTIQVSGRKGINSGAIFTQNPEEIYLTLSMAKNADIYKMNLNTKNLQRVTKHLSDDVDPHINADGSLLTFLSGRAGRAMIYTLDPSGVEKGVQRISYVGRFNASPRFSPDGKEIVFSSWVDNRFDIYKVDSDGKNLVRLTKNFGSNEEAMFSPDGEFIIFSSQRVISRKKAVQDIYIMNRDGEILSKLTNNFGQCFTPRWSK